MADAAAEATAESVRGEADLRRQHWLQQHWHHREHVDGAAVAVENHSFTKFKL